jgi:hypothetical protein
MRIQHLMHKRLNLHQPYWPRSSQAGQASSQMVMHYGTTEMNHSAIDAHFRAPKRLSVTLPHATYEQLVQKSGWEGRSISNLAAFLLENALKPSSF